MTDTRAEGLTFGCQVATYGDVGAAVDHAVRAERAGFDTITVPDHLFHPTDSEEYLTEPAWEAFSVLGAIAQRTDEALLMPGVSDSVRRHPSELAHVTATLDRMTDGRAGLGIGAGEAFNFAPIRDIDWDDPYTRFREAVSVVDGLWASTAADPLSFAGEYFELDDAHLGLKPVQEPRPPLWVGGYGRSMRGLTGAVADGWFPWVYSPEVYERDLQHVLNVAEDRGRDPADLDCAVMVPTTVADDGDAAREASIARNRTNLALRPPLLAEMGYEEVAEETPVMWQMAFDDDQLSELEAAAERIPDEAVDAISVSGDPERAIERVEAFRDAGVDNLVVIPVGDFEETVRHYEETIIPYFADE
ncbi:LLM class flavin-dependent oxidoreductase [Candidatus Halobonum tyrrellensis]|uniref:Luciferase-like monooxygenase superfamily protein n=1 Tax=Candidatus Halobonum tyrrellensis G22 TaxID=1324957 RepID=V4HGN8_9EURY|nr:LLM class flavin-dependent oxidoreductase [Candidatus Halobonum tyrrellensis]ESP86974.1 Luciferase-like monooxygenase superfamily protein [Candidatus Halobonum tyrrellensis G22]